MVLVYTSTKIRLKAFHEPSTVFCLCKQMGNLKEYIVNQVGSLQMLTSNVIMYYFKCNWGLASRSNCTYAFHLYSEMNVKESKRKGMLVLCSKLNYS